MPKKVLVLGARGFLGEHIAQQLAAADHEVLAAVRPGAKHGFTSPHINVVEGDFCDAAFLQAALAHAGAVIFCAGRTWQPGLAIDEYQRQNVAITQAFFDALGQRPEMRVVFTSSLSTIGGSLEPRVYSEDTGRDGIREDWLTPYDRAKIACEQLAIESANRGNNVVILNPGLLLGPGAFSTSNLAAPYYLLWFCQGQFTAKFYVNGGVTLSDVRDVARAHVIALEKGRAGERYIVGGHQLDRRQFYAHVSRLTGLPAPRALPPWFLYTLMATSDGVSFVTRGLIGSPVHRSFARTQKLYYYGASEKAAHELDFRITPIETTILDMLHYYQACGLLPSRFDFLKGATAETAPAHVLLKQLIEESGYARQLLPRFSQLFAACMSNHALSEALHQLLQAGEFDERRGRFRWDRTKAGPHLAVLQKFFEYAYFSSNEFLQEVL